LACGQVVEPSFCLSAVRILTSNYGLPKIGFCPKKKLAPRDGLLGASRLALRVALAGDRRRCAASSNRLVYVGGSNYGRPARECGRRQLEFL
jgi:hypothetical protein